MLPKRTTIEINRVVSNRSKGILENDTLENAGRFLDRHAMVWIRKLDLPASQVWEAVSTKQGLDAWWISPVEIDLRPSGAFSHHWGNTITDLKEFEYIDFCGDPSRSGGMRFELKADGEGTVFSFLCNWAADSVPKASLLPEETDGIDTRQPGGPGTPWSGVAGGWHASIDDLETHLTGRTFHHSYEDLCRFYTEYLADHFAWLDLMTEKRVRAKSPNG